MSTWDSPPISPKRKGQNARIGGCTWTYRIIGGTAAGTATQKGQPAKVFAAEFE
jgi:hypothetical protein